jgi:hypothetical protein
LLFLIFIKQSHAQETNNILATYKSSTYKHSLGQPQNLDEIRNQFPTYSIPIDLGWFYYKNHFCDTIIKTQIEFKPAPGINIGNGSCSVGYIFNFIKEAFFISTEREDSNFLKYKLPNLEKIGNDSLVNGYRSTAYSFTNQHGVTYRIWFSKEIPDAVTLEFFYKGNGGVTKIEYICKDVKYVLDLVGFEKTKSIDSFYMPQINSKKMRTSIEQLFPFFDAK